MAVNFEGQFALARNVRFKKNKRILRDSQTKLPSMVLADTWGRGRGCRPNILEDNGRLL